jgi:Tol biopolymer transport system component
MNTMRHKPIRFILRPLPFIFVLCLSACTTMWNPSPPAGEAQSLTDIVRLGDGFAQSGGARFSGDGKWLLFHANPSGEISHVYLAQLRGTDRQSPPGAHRPIRITPANMTGGDGSFSPDGRSLYFACAPNVSHAALTWPIMRLYRADGWQGAVAALAPGESIDLAQHPIVSANCFNGEVSVAPGGQWLIFTSTRDGGPDIYAASIDGSRPQRLTHTGGSSWASLSPDGRQLLCQRQIGDGMQIMVADLVFDPQGAPTGIKHERTLTEAGGFGACWHPDGNHILYAATDAAGDTELFVMRADGSRPTRLTFSPGVDMLPALSPDGHWLSWTSARGKDHTPQLYLARFKLPEGS